MMRACHSHCVGNRWQPWMPVPPSSLSGDRSSLLFVAVQAWLASSCTFWGVSCLLLPSCCRSTGTSCSLMFDMISTECSAFVVREVYDGLSVVSICISRLLERLRNFRVLVVWISPLCFGKSCTPLFYSFSLNSLCVSGHWSFVGH